jgi:hypothetical protein
MSVLTFETDLLPPPELKLPTLSLARFSEKIDNQSFLDYRNIPVPKGINNVASFDINNLATSKDIAKLQDEANAVVDKQYKESTWRGLTLRLAVKDTYEALTGIPADIYKNSGNVSLKNLLTRNNRLRGLGIFFVLFAVMSIFFVTLG